MALGKILSVLPNATRVAAESMAIFTPPIGLDPTVQNTLQTLREAAQVHRKVQVQYSDGTDQLTQRILRALGCFYWGKVWTLAALGCHFAVEPVTQVPRRNLINA